MAETNAIEYLEKYGKSGAYICGDFNNATCGLEGKLADLGCDSCGFKVGFMGKNTINKEAKIHYNEQGYFTDLNEKDFFE